MKLRPYQVSAISALRHKFLTNKRILLVSPTGSGKTAIFCEILKSVYDKNKSAIMVVRGRSLVDQASERLAEYNVPHGVRMSGHWNNRPHERIQVCSIDTLFRRKQAPAADLVVIDESHTAGGDSYKWLFSHYPEALFLPVTATPYSKKGMRHVADDYITAISMAELIQQQFLVPLKYFAPSTINISGVKIDSTGDYNAKQLYEAADDKKIYGDLVENYQKLIPGKTAIAFGVNVAHSKKIAESFNAAGIPAKHIDANSPLSERKIIIAELIRKEIFVISSVGTMTTGIDIPSLDAIIIARPTASLNLHIQMIGRVTRISPGKTVGIILDHAGNTARHGLAEFDRAVNLDGFTPEKSDPKPVTCKQCYAVFLPESYICPICQHDNTPDKRERNDDIAHAEADLSELSAEQLEKMTIRNDFENYEQLRNRTNKGGKPYNWRWTFHKLIEQYGEHKISEIYPSKMKGIKWRNK